MIISLNSADIALLASVPEEHLVSGLITCESKGKVAFGSKAFQVFRDLDRLREGLPCEAYIYASDSSIPGKPKVRWIATYTGHVESQSGRHPDGMRYRPSKTEDYPSDNWGHWAVFWEVINLRRLAKEDAIPMNKFMGAGTRKSYVSGFAPHGPSIVDPLETI